MKLNLLWIYLISIISFHLYSQNPVTNNSDWTVSNITADDALEYPNTILYGPDDELWITERIGKKVVKINKVSGSKTILLDLSSIIHQSKGQDGLMGMAIHPDLYTNIATTTNNYVFIAYTYDIDGTDDNDDNTELDVDRKLIIERYEYDYNNDILDPITATTIIDGLDASNDHNSGKLVIGPDLKLYYTMGDQGANQFINACKPIRSQELPTTSSDYGVYKGKILRFNLDGTIPSDNPTLNGVQSHVYTYGHRNPQGIIFGSNGKLYSSEHGGKVDDEINIIEAGKNYGWPEISGGFDDYGFTYCNWSTTPGGCTGNGFSNHNCAPGVTAMTESMSYPSGAPANFQGPIGTYGSSLVNEPFGGWLSWPTVAPSSIEIYEGGLIPNWGTSLLIPTLKRGTIFRVKLNTAGDAIEGNPSLLDGSVYEEFHSSNDRYRDVAIDPDGITIYAITDNTGGTSGPSGTSGVTIENPGVVMKIQYSGSVLNTSTPNKTDFKLFPNPTVDGFKIQFNNTIVFDTFNINITDMQGRIIRKLNYMKNNEFIPTETLSKGMYFIEILSDNANNPIGSTKLIKQ